jgi:hypothetical protein
MSRSWDTSISVFKKKAFTPRIEPAILDRRDTLWNTMARRVDDSVGRSYLGNGLSVCDVQRLILTAWMRRIFWFLNHQIPFSRSKVVRENVIASQEKFIRHCQPCCVSALHAALPAQCYSCRTSHYLNSLTIWFGSEQPFLSYSLWRFAISHSIAASCSQCPASYSRPITVKSFATCSFWRALQLCRRSQIDWSSRSQVMSINRFANIKNPRFSVFALVFLALALRWPWLLALYSCVINYALQLCWRSQLDRSSRSQVMPINRFANIQKRHLFTCFSCFSPLHNAVITPIHHVILCNRLRSTTLPKIANRLEQPFSSYAH